LSARSFAVLSIAAVFLAMVLFPVSIPVSAGEQATAVGGLQCSRNSDIVGSKGRNIGPAWKETGSTPAGYITAEVSIDPDTINLMSRGKWITGYIELPPGMDPEEIEVGTVLLNGVIPAAQSPTGIGDIDNDGIPDLMVKFPRDQLFPMFLRELEMNVNYLDGPVELSVSGVSPTVGPFTGSDWVFVNCWRWGQWSQGIPINRLQTSISITVFQTPNQVGTTWWSVVAMLKNPAGIGVPNKTLKFYWRAGAHTGIGENCVNQACPVAIVTNAVGTAGISVGFVWDGQGVTTHVDVVWGGDCFYMPSSANSAPIVH